VGTTGNSMKAFRISNEHPYIDTRNFEILMNPKEGGGDEIND
jgi:hypothetical protein